MNYLEISSGNNILRGIQHSSLCLVETPQPIVMVHGYFSATRNGPHRLFVEIANQLASLGYTVYRFDLSGMGESDGDIKNITFQNHVDDLGAIVNYVQQEHQNQKINLIAHSLGCNIALSQMQKHVELYNRIIFLAPYLTNKKTIRLIINDTEKIQELTKNNFTYRKGLYVDSSYFIESEVKKFQARLAGMPFKVNIILGEEDQFIPQQLTIDVLKNIGNIDLACIPNADHNFLETHNELMWMISNILKS